MSKPDNLLLEYMRRFDRRLSEIDAKMDRVLDDVHMLKVRMTPVEENLVGIQRRVDRVEERLERIDRRVGLIDAAH